MPVFTKEDTVNTIYKVGATPLFERYAKSNLETNHKDEHNTIAFGREISTITGQKCNTYAFDLQETIGFFAAGKVFGFVGDAKPQKTEVTVLDAVAPFSAHEIGCVGNCVPFRVKQKSFNGPILL